MENLHRDRHQKDISVDRLGEPTEESLERERGEERKRVRAEIGVTGL